VDLAVHSLKDLPSAQPQGLSLACFLPREDPRDALVGRAAPRLEELPAGARIGTSSPRRAAFLRHLRPDCTVADIRGNVETRLRKLDTGAYDAIVLAAAGLKRLGQAHVVTQYFDPEVFVPAVGQGALVIECRADDARLHEMLRPVDHLPTRWAVEAERAFLHAVGGGCSTPIGAFAEIRGAVLHLIGAVIDPAGVHVVRCRTSGDPAQRVELARTLAGEVLAAAAAAAPAVFGADRGPVFS